MMRVKMAEIPTSLISIANDLLSPPISEGFKFLLEKKHLYQNYEIKLPEFDSSVKLVESLLQSVSQEQVEITTRLLLGSCAKNPWTVNKSATNSFKRTIITGVRDEDSSSILVSFKTIKSRCPICDEIEPYNFIEGNEVLKVFADSNPTQVFILNFQCQSCKSNPEVFLIRRNGMKISIHGRSPIEAIKVPSYIPKNQTGFFSDAILANQTGQHLAAVFLLRTIIEQYVRSVSNDMVSQNIDELFKKYGDLLPNVFKQRFPSLKTVYDRLSIAIHSAEASEECFEENKSDIEWHFEAKRTFRLK
jgi:hypothetical protein